MKSPSRSEKLTTYLQAAGKSVTKPRLAVFEVLSNSEPLHMSELVRLVGEGTDRASVYRVVALFEELHIIHRITIGWKYKLELSDAFHEHHHHLSCVRCHKVVPLNDSEIESFIEAASFKHGFTPTQHTLEIQGYCADCR